MEERSNPTRVENAWLIFVFLVVKACGGLILCPGVLPSIYEVVLINPKRGRYDALTFSAIQK
jgi:hypothetical protein